MKMLEAVSVICCITLLCIQPRESHSSHNLQLEQSTASHNQSEDGQSGHNQSEDGQSGHNQSEDSQSGHNQSEDSQPGHNQSETDSRSGHNQSETDSRSGHNQSETDSRSGHSQSEADSQSGHSQSEDSQLYHSQSEHDQSLWEYVQETLQVGCETHRIRLDLSHRNLTHLPPAVFNHSCAWRVVTLDLSHNRLGALDPDSLAPLTSLRALNLSHNQLRALCPGTLPDRLLALNASLNRLTQLHGDLFRNVPFLQRVDLSHNHIIHVQPGAFHPGLQGLFWVSLSHNRLTDFEPWPYVLSQTASVDLSHNVISRFTNRMNFTVTREMQGDVILTYNNLTHLHRRDFTIYLGGQTPTAMGLAFYFKLNIRHNPLQCDCHVYWLVETLSNNLLEENSETQTYFTCAGPPSLRGRSLGFLLAHAHLLVCDVIRGCPDGCRCADTPHHRHLAVTCDPALRLYTRLPQKLPGDGLLSLNLSGHALRRLEAGWGEVSRLQVLDVSNNRVRQVSASFLDQASHLQVLNLKNNQLTSLPSNLQRLSVDGLHLTGNPLSCSCDLVWFGNWVKAVAANTSSLDPSGSGRPPQLPQDLERWQNADPQPRADLWQLMSVNLSKPPPPRPQAVPHVPGTLPDSLALTCSLPEGRKVAVVDTQEWGRGCGSRVTLHVLTGAGAALLVVLVAMGACWRCRRNVRVLLSYCRYRVRCCHPSPPSAPDDAESGQLQVCPVYEVYVSLDEGDEVAVTWVISWLLPLLEDMGHNPLPVYLPLKQEPPGVYKAGSRAEAIGQSRKVLVVLSSGYASNGWCRHEFDHACHHLQQYNSSNLIIVVLDLNQATGTRGCRGTAGTGPGGAIINRGCNSFIRHQTHDDNDDGRRCIINCQVYNPDKNDDGEENESGDANALSLSFRSSNVFSKLTTNSGVSDRNTDGNAVPSRNRKDNFIPDRKAISSAVLDRDRKDNAIPDRKAISSAVLDRNRKDNAIPDRNTVNTAVPNRKRDDGAVPDRMGSSGVVPNRNRDDGPVPDRMRNGVVVPDRNRDDGPVPDRMRNGGVVPDRNSKGAAAAVEDIELDAIDLDMAMNNTDDPGLNKAVTRESRYPHQTPTDDRKDKRYPHQTPTDDRKDKRYPHQTPTDDRKDKRYPHQTPTDDRKDKRYPHQTPTDDRKKKRHLARSEERVMGQLEAMSEFLEDGEVVTLEPLRSFLLQGRYLRTSDWLFRYKLFYELCRQRRGRQD